MASANRSEKAECKNLPVPQEHQQVNLSKESEYQGLL
jgi:hypothetical protein